MNQLTELQKEKLHRLEPRLERALVANDLSAANNIVAEIQNLLRPTGHEIRLIQSKNKLYEAYMNNGDYNHAISGFMGIRQKVNSNTRTYLESSVMLAICYIRIKDIDKAEPIIKEVLTNDKVIKSESRRTKFRKNVIERFDQEGILFGIRDTGRDILNVDEVNKEVIKVIGQTEDEMYLSVGNAVPESAINILLRVDSFSKKQLPYNERKLIGVPIVPTDRKEVGKTLFASVKRVLYNSLCDPKSEIYQAWYNNGIKVVLEKKFIVGAVVAMMAGFGIGINAIAASIVALIIKFGIEVFCEKNKPTGIMEMR